MDGMLTLLVLLPLAGFVLNGVFGRRFGTGFVNAVGVGLPFLAFVTALWAWRTLEAGGGAPIVETVFTWAVVGEYVFEVSFYLDRLSAVMALIVTGVGALIHLYSIGYMKGDEGYARYFAYLNLFLFFMLLLVLGRSLLVLFVGWEGVGLASYLLIGFWFQDAAKARAGRKAFITNRVGDAGFLLGMFLVFVFAGTLEMDGINEAFGAGLIPAGIATAAGILLFIGATGKSAQIPLHVWLPDAMAGPTPVSALIHAATMVTAGVYLVARLSGVYLETPAASTLIAVIGVLTAFLAATIALVQTDIKKVLAYSTISQLGFMFLALGVGAYGVAVFHLFTHAFFKAALFLGAGSVIHALNGEQDIRRMGGLARPIPWTFATFAIATAAIAGLPPLAGFFSKDEILWFALASGQGGAAWLWALGSLTALLTALYMFRLLWLVFLGRSRMAPETERHVHESPVTMTGVLVVLAFFSVIAGWFALPQYLEPLLPLPELLPERAGLHFAQVVFAVQLALLGLIGAWVLYRDGGRPAEALWARATRLHRVLEGKYFVDELYARLLTRPWRWVSDRVFLRLGDRILLDGTLHGLAALARAGAAALTRVQSGSLHWYAWITLFGLAAVLIWMWRHV
ncbi:NADH-ubiquinone oxidoreductase chain L [Thioalkalivibrio nitratireducens DSM 14787]|uniref:NADH-ubiquinone oxidoreductase chain L n=1 Tax=Thioalkalivibrio nitratireducens (strain DSM 14787 / UNIQEM 213 / ALEN2) TaxID=1255043 RepID=L0DZ12_THIND|nr:NADH-quinone oxidoreductase subunit L [Thioalkalivibrio nitratireducens]AGA33606.1 NADH-ubiquinone oxidoreductase chain L [Thioalkalivibrio nitratireducens DSM 14787]